MPKEDEKKKSTAVAKTDKKSTAIAPAGILKTGRGFEDMDRDDLIVPYVKIMQPLSPEVQDDDVKAKQGDLLNSLSKNNYGTTIKFIPIMFRKRRIKWIPRDEGGGMDCASIDGKIPDTGEMYSSHCLTCEHRQWHGDNPPECDLIYGFPAIVLGAEQANKLVIISFTRTSFSAGKKLLNQMRFAGGDMFGRPYEVSTKKENKKDGNTTYTYYVLTAQPAGELKPEELKEAEGYYNLLQESVVSYHEEDTSPESDDGMPF